jgi:hypothetical protein
MQVFFSETRGFSGIAQPSGRASSFHGFSTTSALKLQKNTQKQKETEMSERNGKKRNKEDVLCRTS